MKGDGALETTGKEQDRVKMNMVSKAEPESSTGSESSTVSRAKAGVAKEDIGRREKQAKRLISLEPYNL